MNKAWTCNLIWLWDWALVWRLAQTFNTQVGSFLTALKRRVKRESDWLQQPEERTHSPKQNSERPSSISIMVTAQTLRKSAQGMFNFKPCIVLTATTKFVCQSNSKQ